MTTLVDKTVLGTARGLGEKPADAIKSAFSSVTPLRCRMIMGEIDVTRIIKNIVKEDETLSEEEKEAKLKALSISKTKFTSFLGAGVVEQLKDAKYALNKSYESYRMMPTTYIAKKSIPVFRKEQLKLRKNLMKIVDSLEPEWDTIISDYEQKVVDYFDGNISESNLKKITRRIPTFKKFKESYYDAGTYKMEVLSKSNTCIDHMNRVVKFEEIVNNELTRVVEHGMDDVFRALEIAQRCVQQNNIANKSKGTLMAISDKWLEKVKLFDNKDYNELGLELAGLQTGDMTRLAQNVVEITDLAVVITEQYNLDVELPDFY